MARNSTARNTQHRCLLRGLNRGDTDLTSQVARNTQHKCLLRGVKQIAVLGVVALLSVSCSGLNGGSGNSDGSDSNSSNATTGTQSGTQQEVATDNPATDNPEASATTTDARNAELADTGSDSGNDGLVSAPVESGFAREGVLTFRGSPTRTYYGAGPVPTNPYIAWAYPTPTRPALTDIPTPETTSPTVATPTTSSPVASPNPPDANTPDINTQDTTPTTTTTIPPEPNPLRLCSLAPAGVDAPPVEWCGTGWTGQPAVFEYQNRTWVVFGAYDGAIHFLDATDGSQIIPSFPTDGLVKGSVTVDPDGYPLIYIGSRDNFFRVIAFDRPTPTQLWALSAYLPSVTYWNNDWDSSALIRDDYLFAGGENSNFHIVKLNRSYNPDGQATVSPQVEHIIPGWDDQLLRDLPDRNLSIENSPVIVGDVIYFANSGGLVQGWDISGLGSAGEEGADWQPRRVFRFWAGGDVDASIVADEDGMLYVGAQRERQGEQYADMIALAEEVGQIFKLDPARPDDPLVWSVSDLIPLETNDPLLREATGVWATPALHGDMLYVATNTGRLLGIDRETGVICWEKNFDKFLWSSPVVVDDILLQADAEGFLHAWDLGAQNLNTQSPGNQNPGNQDASNRDSSNQGPCDTDTSNNADTAINSGPSADARNSGPPKLWQLALSWRIEATPAVWGGMIFVGGRGDQMYAVASR